MKIIVHILLSRCMLAVTNYTVGSLSIKLVVYVIRTAKINQITPKYLVQITPRYIFANIFHSECFVLFL